MKTMKIFAAMFVAALTLGLASCSKDYEEDIVGTWDLQKITISQTISGLTGDYEQYNGTQSQNLAPEEGESSTFTFNSDGTCTSVDIDAEGTETRTGTWSIKDETLTMTLAEEGGEPETNVMHIDKLEDNKLVLSMSETQTDSESIPGQVAKITYTIKLEMKKK